MSKLSAIILAAAIAVPTFASATTLDFEEFTTFTQLGTSFTVQDYQFTATSGDVLAYPVGAVINVPESGSTSIAMSNNPNAPIPVNSSLTLSRIDGTAFSLSSFRAAEGRNQGQFFAAFASTGLNLLATFMDNSTSLTSITFDGIASDNGATDFELFSFSGFDNLASLTFTGVGGTRGGYSFSLDDIAVSVPAPIPLPAGLPLLLSGLGSVLVLRRARRKS